MMFDDEKKPDIEARVKRIDGLHLFLKEVFSGDDPEVVLAALYTYGRVLRHDSEEDIDALAKKLALMLELEHEYTKKRAQPGQETGIDKFKEEFTSEVRRAQGRLTPDQRKRLQEVAPDTLKHLDGIYDSLGGMDKVFDSTLPDVKSIK